MQRNQYELLPYDKLCEMVTNLETTYKNEKNVSSVQNTQREGFFKAARVLMESMQVDRVIPAFAEKAAKVMTGLMVAEMELIEHEYQTYYKLLWGPSHSTTYQLLAKEIKLDPKQHRALRLTYLVELFDYLQREELIDDRASQDKTNKALLMNLIQNGLDRCVKRQKDEITKTLTQPPTPTALFRQTKDISTDYQKEIENRSYLRQWLVSGDGKEQIKFIEFIQRACEKIFANEKELMKNVNTYEEAKKFKSYTIMQATMVYLALMVESSIPGKSQCWRHKRFLRAIHKSDISQISFDDRIDMLTTLLSFINDLKKEIVIIQVETSHFPNFDLYLARTEKSIYQLLAEQHAKKANPYGLLGRIAYEGSLAAVKYGVGIAIIAGMEIALVAAAPVVITAASAAIGAPMVFLIRKGIEMLVSTPIVDTGLRKIMGVMVEKISVVASEKATATGYVVVKPTIEGAVGLVKTYMEAAPQDTESPREWRDALLKLPNLTEEEKQMLREAIPAPISEIKAAI